MNIETTNTDCAKKNYVLQIQVPGVQSHMIVVAIPIIWSKIMKTSSKRNVSNIYYIITFYIFTDLQ